MSSGCGSGHQTTTPVPTPTPITTPTPTTPTTVKATITWPQRSRQTTATSSGSPVQIAALTSASSALITLTGANTAGGDIVIDADRPSGAAAAISTYVSTGQAKPGTYPLTVKFYNKPLASGAIDSTATVVATAQANVQILGDGTISATITTVGQIQSVVVTPGQTLTLGSSSAVGYTAYGAPVGNQQVIIPVAAGVETVTATNVDTTKAPVVSVANGILTATAPGKAIVTVTVDNISSDPTATSSVISVVSAQTLSISPNPATVAVGGQLKLTATTVNPAGSAVTWSLGTDAATAASGATIDPNTGVFTATNRSGGPYTVIATSQYDLTKTTTGTVTVTSNVNVFPTGQDSTVKSLALSVGANKTISLPVTVTGNADTSVTYTIVGNTTDNTSNGTITAAGAYTAPNAEGNYVVIATSQADTSKSVEFDITVTPSVTIAPHATTISVDQTVTFFANVVGGTNGKVVYSVVESGGGTITSTGVYTAPDTAGTYHVTATSVADPTESDTATIVVQAGSGVIIIE